MDDMRTDEWEGKQLCMTPSGRMPSDDSLFSFSLNIMLRKYMFNLAYIYLVSLQLTGICHFWTIQSAFQKSGQTQSSCKLV